MSDPFPQGYSLRFEAVGTPSGWPGATLPNRPVDRDGVAFGTYGSEILELVPGEVERAARYMSSMNGGPIRVVHRDRGEILVVDATAPSAS